MKNQSKEKIIQDAEKIYFSNHNMNLHDFLLPYKDKFKNNAENIDIKFQNLLAFSYAFQNKVSDVETLCSKNLSEQTYPLDCYFILSYTHLSLREFAKALEYAQKYLSLYNELNQPECNYSYTENHYCQLLNFIGSAHMELGNHEKAVESFTKAITQDKENHLPYINLANMYIRNNQLDKASDIIKKGLHTCSQIQELRLLEKSIKERPSVSACMIVKNEEELLPECLDSIRDWVDEIIIVDTGSSDKTIEIAKSYGAKVFHQEWEGNFSKHRNYSLAQATSEWIFIIDADERIITEDIPTLIQSLQNKNVSIVSINVFNVYGNREETTTFLPSVRLWRRSLNLQYEGVVHNLLNLGVEHPVVRVDVRLKHLGYDLSPQKMHEKFIRTKTLLEQQLTENPDNAFALFNYAQLLKADRSKGEDYPLHNNELIIQSAQRAVDVTSPEIQNERHIHLMCLNQLGWAYFHEQKYDKAYEYAQMTLSYKKNYLDTLLLVGHIFAQHKIWDKAQDGYKKYLEAQAIYSPQTEVDPLILSHIDDRASANYSLGLIAEIEQDIQLAKSYYHKSLDANIGFLESNFRLGKIYHQEQNLEMAKKYYQQQAEYSKKTPDLLIELASIAEAENKLESADLYYNEAIKLEEFNPESKIKYARYLLNQQKIDKAKGILNQVISSVCDKNIFIIVGNIYFQSALYNDAIESYSKISDPSADILNNIAN